MDRRSTSRLTSYSTQTSPKQKQKENLVNLVKSYDIPKYLEKQRRKLNRTPDPFRNTQSRLT